MNPDAYTRCRGWTTTDNRAPAFKAMQENRKRRLANRRRK